MLARTGEFSLKKIQQNQPDKCIFKAQVSLTLAFVLKNASARELLLLCMQKMTL